MANFLLQWCRLHDEVRTRSAAHLGTDFTRGEAVGVDVGVERLVAERFQECIEAILPARQPLGREGEDLMGVERGHARVTTFQRRDGQGN